MQARLLAPEDPAWTGVLSSVQHDTYHLPSYVVATARHFGGKPLGVHVWDGDCFVLVPLILRSLPYGLGGFDVVSPYGYPSPLASSSALADERFLEVAGEAIRNELRAARCASAFIRCHPLLVEPEALFRRVGCHQPLGQTVWIDLRCSDEDRWKQMDRTTRSSINRTRLEGYEAGVDNAWSKLDEFVRLYKLTMDRAGAAQSYYFDIGYFRALKEGLAGAAHLLHVSRRGRIVSAGIFLETCSIVQSHLSGSERLLGALSGDRLMVDFAATWFAERGNSVLHLGGGRGSSQDSLFRFKSGFAPNRGSYAVWRLVADEDLFAAACDAAGVSSYGSTNTSGFFPPYRHGIVE